MHYDTPIFITPSTFIFNDQYTAYGPTNFEKEIDALLTKMTLEEKVGQMNQYDGFYELTGPAPEVGNVTMKYEYLKKGMVGGSSVEGLKGSFEVE